MGHGFLYQSDAAGRIGAIFARSQNPHGRREKVDFGGSSAARGSPKSTSKFAILSDSARYPSGPRERSANPLLNPVATWFKRGFADLSLGPLDRKSTRLNSSH